MSLLAKYKWNKTKDIKRPTENRHESFGQTKKSRFLPDIVPRNTPVENKVSATKYGRIKLPPLKRKQHRKAKPKDVLNLELDTISLYHPGQLTSPRRIKNDLQLTSPRRIKNDFKITIM